MNIYLILLGMALVTALPRVAPLLLLRGELPLWLQRWLSFVPIAIFMALILPPLLLREENDTRFLTIGPALPAGIVGALVSWRTNNVLLTIAAGLATFWLMKLI